MRKNLNRILNAVHTANPASIIVAGVIIAASVVGGLVTGYTDNPVRDLLAQLPATILGWLA